MPGNLRDELEALEDLLKDDSTADVGDVEERRKRVRRAAEEEGDGGE